MDSEVKGLKKKKKKNVKMKKRTQGNIERRTMNMKMNGIE
jgi:hypothetical protein